MWCDLLVQVGIPLGLWAAVMAWAHYDLKVRILRRRRARGKYIDSKGVTHGG